MLVQNCLVGTGLREHIKIGASGKVTNGFDVVKRVTQGADFTLAARAMMFAVGCIQAMKCHTNRCPPGWPPRTPAWPALDVPDKIDRVANFQKAVVASAAQMMVASMGLELLGIDAVHAQSAHRLLAQPHLRRDLRVADARRTAGVSARGLAVRLDRGLRRGIRLNQDRKRLRDNGAEQTQPAVSVALMVRSP